MQTVEETLRELDQCHGDPGNGIKQEETDWGFRHFNGERREGIESRQERKAKNKKNI